MPLIQKGRSTMQWYLALIAIYKNKTNSQEPIIMESSIDQ